MLQSLTDTLTCDSSLLHQYRSDEAYDYARELHAPDVNLWEWLMQKIGELLNDIFSINDKGDIRIIIYIGLSLVFIGVIAFLMYRFQPRLFSRSGRLKEQNIDEDNIYGVDFGKEYAKAMGQKDYYKAVRIVYLRTLRWLSDNKKISWELYKTPTQYTREFLSTDFQHMTHCFMRIRYGNYTATEGLVMQMEAWESEMKKGGTV